MRDKIIQILYLTVYQSVSIGLQISRVAFSQPYGEMVAFLSNSNMQLETLDQSIQSKICLAVRLHSPFTKMNSHTLVS